jgi:hypothetical protein
MRKGQISLWVSIHALSQFSQQACKTMNFFDDQEKFLEDLLKNYNREKARLQEIERSAQEQKQFLLHYEAMIQHIAKRKIAEMDLDKVDELDTITELNFARECEPTSEPFIVERSENCARQPEEFYSNLEISQRKKVAPQQMLRPRFQQMSQKEIIQTVLEEANKPLKAVDVAREAYDCKTDDDFRRASDSVGVALRHGVGKFWNKLPGRGGSFVRKNFSSKPPSPQTEKRATPDQVRDIVSIVQNGRV